jgi:hypothetical protein
MQVIRRVEFLGFRVDGPGSRSYGHYTPREWERWTCSVKGQRVLFTGPEGESIDAPAGQCLIYAREEAAP